MSYLPKYAFLALCIQNTAPGSSTIFVKDHIYEGEYFEAERKGYQHLPEWCVWDAKDDACWLWEESFPRFFKLIRGFNSWNFETNEH